MGFDFLSLSPPTALGDIFQNLFIKIEKTHGAQSMGFQSIFIDLTSYLGP